MKHHHPTKDCDGRTQCHAGCVTRQQVAKRKSDPSFAQRLTTMAATALRGAVAVGQHVVAGLPVISDAEKATRLAICEVCPEFQPNRTCGVCRCHMDMKAAWGEQQCPLDKWPKPPIVANMGAGGLGDALLGSCAVNGLRKAHPDRQVIYKVGYNAIPFVQLFDMGIVVVTKHDWDETKDEWPKTNLDDLQMNVGHGQELRMRGKYPRLQRFCRNVGGVTPDKPQLRDRDRLLAMGREYAGAVALAPFGAWQAREYPLALWQETERLLIEAGHRMIVLDAHRHELKSEQAVGRSAEVVASILLNARCLIGNDSGLSHLSAIIGTPTTVLCGQTTGPEIYGFYGQHVRFLDGHMVCKGCWWQPPYNQGCEPRCPNLSTSTPQEIVASVP